MTKSRWRVNPEYRNHPPYKNQGAKLFLVIEAFVIE